MKRTFTLLACAGMLFLAGCTSDSALPNPTGKGVVRAIHAIPGATDVTFKIEERGLYLSMNHCARITEKILVVGAL